MRRERASWRPGAGFEELRLDRAGRGLRRLQAGTGSSRPHPDDPKRPDYGHGCANGAYDDGAILWGDGWSSVSSDTLVLRVQQTTAAQPGLFFQGLHATNGGAGLVFGDGLRCAGGSVVRLQVRVANADGGARSSIAVASEGGDAPGDVRRYQWWYRAPGGSPCGAGFNLSNGLEIRWAP